MADFASSRQLRVALFPSFMYVKTPSGELAGVAVELARALGARLGIEAVLCEFPAPPQVVDSLATGACDVAFLGIDPARAADVDFARPLMRADLTFLVPAASAALTIKDADRPGARIAVVRNHAMDTALRGKLAHAEKIYADTPDAAFELLLHGKVDICAGIRPGLIAYAARLPGSRVLDDRYASNTIALAVCKGQAERLARLDDFTREAKASGLAQRALANAGLHGVEVPAQ